MKRARRKQPISGCRRQPGSGFMQYACMAMLLVWLWGSGMPLRANAEQNPQEALPVLAQPDPGEGGRIRLVFWVGSGLLLVGLGGGLSALLLSQRRQLQREQDTQREERDRFQGYMAAQQIRQHELEVEIERQQRMVKTVRDSEQRFRTLAEQLPEGVFMTDAQDKCH